jgi:hypothetical protein
VVGSVEWSHGYSSLCRVTGRVIVLLCTFAVALSSSSHSQGLCVLRVWGVKSNKYILLFLLVIILALNASDGYFLIPVRLRCLSDAVVVVGEAGFKLNPSDHQNERNICC